jgi:phosphoribosylformylglycinamidine synthase
LKEAGNFVFILGRTCGHLGGSHYLMVEGVESGGDVPPVDMATSKRTMLAISSAIAAGLVRSCHDLSEGGLAVATAEMAIAGNLGVELNLAAVPTDLRGASVAAGTYGISEAALLFAESAGRFLVEVTPENHDKFLRLLKDCPFGELGRVNDTGRIVITAANGTVIDLTVESSAAAWKGTFQL